MENFLELDDLEVVGFKPFNLSDNPDFKYNMTTSAIQLILGTNGCGKSSLLRLLSVNFVDPKEFNKDGYRILKVRGPKGSYVLTSEYGKTTEHSFILNNEELNPGGTGKVYKDLISEHFNYDTNLHKLLTGAIGFTQMSPLARKELIFRISSIDLDYALKVFDDLKTSHRDTLGAIKHINGKLDRINLSTENKSDLEDLTFKSTKLHKLIADLRRSSPGEFESSHSMVEEMAELTEVINSKLRYVKPSKGFVVATSFEERMVIENDVKCSTLEKEIKEASQKIEDLNGISTHISDNDGSIDTDELDKEISVLENNKSKLDCNFGILPEYSEKGMADVNDLMVFINTTLIPLQAELDCFNTGDANMAIRKEVQLKEEVGKLKVNVERMEERLHHDSLLNDGNVSCEKCGHLNVINSSMDKVERRLLESGLIKAKELLETKGEELETASNNADEGRKFIHYLGTIRNFSETNSVTKSFVLSDFVTEASSVYTHLHTTYTKLLAYQKFLPSITRLDTLCRLRDAIMVSNVGFDTNSVKYYEDKFDEMSRELNAARAATDNLKERLKETKRLSAIRNDVNKDVQRLNHLAIEYCVSTAHEHNRGELERHLTDLDIVTRRLDAHYSVVNTVIELEADCKQLEDDRLSYENLLRALSPNTGIIADAVGSVLRAFTADINRSVQRVWEYDMVVEPYANANKLNYKFPLTINGNVVPDIGNASQGQKDIIDLAATLNVMKYRDLTNFPLFLDEVGSSFDFTHRNNFIRLIHEMTSSGECSQVFCVNHFSHQYSSLSNVNTIVLSKDNIVVPDEFNKTLEAI